MKPAFSVAVTSAAFVAAISLISCSSAPRSLDSTPPPVSKADDPERETIVLLGTNDFHGALAPARLKTREAPGVDPVEYEAGGAAVFAGYVKRLRQEFGNRLAVLDAGDEFQGTIDSNSAQGLPVVTFFNHIGISAAAIGNHEFDFGVDALKARVSEAKYPYLSANWVERSSGKMPDVPGLKTRTIISVGRLKVGVIGLTTRETPTTTLPAVVEPYLFTDLKEATLREAKALRQEGADLIVALGHVGLSCEPGAKGKGLALRKESDSQGACADSDEMVKLLEALPEGTVDAAIAGHSHQVVHHWVNGVPVSESGAHGRYFNLVYLSYDLGKKQVERERTRIEGPIPICSRVFERQRDCNGEAAPPKAGRGSLVEPIFHGQTVYPDTQVAALLKPVFASSAAVKAREIGRAARPVEHTRAAESELGNLVADAIRTAAGTDAALINPGGLRAPFEQGAITYESLFRTLPFENSLVTLRVSGKELKRILRVAESGARGFFPTSGLQLRLIDLPYDAPADDLNGDGKIAPWEINRLIDAKLANGTAIDDKKTYSLVTVDFLVAGGDDMGWVMKQIPKDRIAPANGATTVIRDAVGTYLGRNSPVNTEQQPLVRADAPRLKLEKGPPPRKSTKSRRKA